MRQELDRTLQEIRSQEPAAAEIEQAAARVRQRLFPSAEVAGAVTGAIRNCAGFVELLPASLAGSLDPARQMLLDVHIRECVECRKTLNRMRSAADRVVVMPAAAPRRRVNYQTWAIAATVVLVAGVAATWGIYEFPALGGGPRATVERVDGALYRVSGGELIQVSQGAELRENEIVRTAKNSTAMLRLNDGSKVEMNQRAQVYVTRSWTGSTVHLGLGNVIIAAAKQRKGSLQVLTSDCKVSVKGTVFSVDAGTKGSRVAVAEGTVWVDHGERHDVLHKGDQTATSPDVAPTPIDQQFTWSQNSVEYLALLGDFSAVSRQIVAIPANPLRYQSKLMSYLPADAVAVAAIPNIGNTIGEANRIFQQKLAEGGTLSVWWNQLSASQRQNFASVMEQMETASKYLGDEIVIYSSGYKSSPVFVAEQKQPGLEAYLKGQLVPQLISHMRFDNNLFVVSDNPVTLSGGFLGSALYQKLAPEYQQGAGWLFAADLSSAVGEMSSTTGIQDVRYFLATSKTLGTGPDATDNRASLIFSKDRTGVASWLAAPGPMGSLSFVSPDAGFVVSAILKNPTLIVDDLMTNMSRVTDKPVAVTDLASAFGGEVTIAFDGPMLPVPSWKIIAEVYDPGRIQSAFTKLTTEYNADSGHDRTGNLNLTQTDADGRSYYTLKFDKLPWEADWTFVDGYWVAGASRELVSRAIQNRLTGYTLPNAAAFRSMLSRDGNINFSAVMYHNLGQTLAPLLGLLGNLNPTPVQQKSIDALKVGDTPGVITFWTSPDRIDMASRGAVFGMDVSSMLASLNLVKAGGLKQ